MEKNIIRVKQTEYKDCYYFKYTSKRNSKTRVIHFKKDKTLLIIQTVLSKVDEFERYKEFFVIVRKTDNYIVWERSIHMNENSVNILKDILNQPKFNY